MKEKNIFLVRHGQTDYNKKQRFLGRINAELNVFGKKQAREIKDALENKEIEKVFTSPLKRARETAELCFPKKARIKDCLMERDFGMFDGKTRLQAVQIVKKVYPEKNFPAKGFEFIDFCLGREKFGGEQIRKLEKRVFNCFENIMESREENIAVFSHAIWIKTLLRQLKLIDHNFDLHTGSIVLLKTGKKNEIRIIR